MNQLPHTTYRNLVVKAEGAFGVFIIFSPDKSDLVGGIAWSELDSFIHHWEEDDMRELQIECAKFIKSFVDKKNKGYYANPKLKLVPLKP